MNPIKRWACSTGHHGQTWTRLTQRHTTIHAHTISFESPNNLLLNSGRKTEHLWKAHTGTRSTCKPHTEEAPLAEVGSNVH